MQTNELLLNKVIELANANAELRRDICTVGKMHSESVLINSENEAMLDFVEAENDAHVETIAGLQCELDKAAKTIASLEAKITKSYKKK